MPKKTADTGVEAKSERLAKKHIALGICGGIASVEVVKLARELRRHGARLSPFITPSVPRFIGELSIEWACAEKVTENVGPEADHLDHFDLVLVAPATLNTISKCALGIADNAVTLLVAGQLGRRAPVLFVPTMNIDLQNHPLYGEYQGRLEKWGSRFLSAAEEESRLKMPAPEAIAKRVLEILK